MTLTDRAGFNISSKEYNKIREGINIEIMIIVGKAAHTASKIPECLN